ncbi:MAG: type II toxin-antitoxin system RelE/ParE family toxin [Gemmatimonadales bacterium]
MTVRLHVEPTADSEIIEAFEWYRARSRLVARTFLETIDGTLAQIRESPELFPLVHKELRRALVPRFPYAVFFTAESDRIRVVGVVHGKRHPRRWQRRS